MKKCSFFSLSLSLSLLHCVLQQNSSSFFYEVLYKIWWDHFWKKRRKERKNFGEDTLTSAQNGACVRTKNFGKRIPQTHRLTEFLKPTETLLSSRIQKKQKPLIITRAKKKMVRPQWWKVAFSALTCEVLGSPGGNALAVLLYRRYCVELNVYDGWYISRARAGRTFFCSYFFCILGEGFISGVWKLLRCGFVVHFCQKKTRFSKKTSKNLIGCHPLSRSFSLLLGDWLYFKLQTTPSGSSSSI